MFSRLSAEQQARLAPAFSERHFHPGEAIVRRGHHADGWNIIQSGKARISEQRAEGLLLPAVLGPGDTFGDRSLIGPADWTFTVRAESSVIVSTLTSDAFASFQRQLGPDVAAELTSRVVRNAEFEFLKRLRTFGHLPPDRIEALLESVSRATFTPGSYVFREDDSSDCCYIVRTGRIHLLKAVGQSQKQLATRRDGDLIGEIELLYGTPRIASAVASTDVELLVLDLGLFERYFPEGEAREAIFHVATERLLQYQNTFADAESHVEPSRIPHLAVNQVRVPGHFPAPIRLSASTRRRLPGLPVWR